MDVRTPLLLSAAGMVMLACQHAPPQVSAPKPQPERGPDYLSWRRVTPHPQHLAPALDAMCDSPPASRMRSLHKDKVFHVYVNKIGEKAMMSVRTDVIKSPPKQVNKKDEFPDITETLWAFETGPSEPFPDGSVIVKEKWPREAFGPDLKKATRPKTEPELLTVMTKTKGKWVYSVVQNNEVQMGDMKHCAKCHESARVTDYVFRGYERK